VNLRRRIEALEKRRSDGVDRLDELMRDDPRWANAEFRNHVRDWDQRLRHEEKTLEQMRHATRELAAVLWEAAGQPDRTADVRQGIGDPSDEYVAAVAALDADDRHRLRAEIEPRSRR
jgi:hypothetical protein